MANAILNLLAVQFELASVKKLAQTITKQEWQSKTLSKETQKSFGLKSPKLSKALMSLGVPQKHVAAALSGSSRSAEPTKVFWIGNDPEAWFVWNQKSEHFFSCQYDGSGHDRREHDLLDYQRRLLFFWVAGGREVKARAKVRVMMDYSSKDQQMYLYVDRPYGQHSLLLDDLDRLEAFGRIQAATVGVLFGGILFPPVWKREDGAGNDFESKYGGKWGGPGLYTSCEGYQDTLRTGIGGPYTFFVQPGGKGSLLREMYTARKKEGGVYLQTLAEGVYNPQDMSCRYPKEFEKPHKYFSKPMRKYLGATVARFVREYGPITDFKVEQDVLTARVEVYFERSGVFRRAMVVAYRWQGSNSSEEWVLPTHGDDEIRSRSLCLKLVPCRSKTRQDLARIANNFDYHPR